jgi:hypothetical protein
VADLIEDLLFDVANDANMELQNEQDVNGDNFDGRGRPERAQTKGQEVKGQKGMPWWQKGAAPF